MCRARHTPMKSLAIVFAACLVARADVFLLADGSRVEGVATESGDSVTIATFDGKTLHVSKKDIRASTNEPLRNEYFARLKKLKDNDADGRVELALFCQKNRMAKEADELFKAALKINPRHDAAGKALGYELVDGVWKQGEDPTLIIGLRPPPKNPEASSDQAQALSKKISAVKVEQGQPKTQSAEVAALVTECSEAPSALIRLLLPPQFAGALNKVSTEVRQRGAIIAGMTQDRRFMQPLCDAAVFDPEEAVRFAAAKALPLLEEPIAVRKLMDIAISGDSQKHPWLLRKSACIALRRYGSQEIIERLMKELSFELAGGNPRDPKNRLRGKQGGLGSDNPLMMNDNQVEYNVPETELYPVLSAVKEITGQTFDTKDKDMKTWIAWWRQDGQKFQFKD